MTNKFRSRIIRICCLFASLLAGCVSHAQDWTMKKAPLMTKWAADINVNSPLPEYPRPQMVRKDWLNLNGLWEFKSGKASDAVPVGDKLPGKILVPYPVESALSGVMEHHDRLWYRRTFTVPQAWGNKRVLMHFGATDWEAEVYINGKSLGVHKGGYDEISLDVTPYLTKNKEQEVLVRVYDPTEGYGQPRGKQENPPHGNLIMYTPVTGIWQTVWIEPVQNISIKHLKLVPDVDGNRLKIKVDTAGTGNNIQMVATVKDGGKVIGTVSGNAGAELSIPVKNAKLWSPDNPFLYDLTVEVKSGNIIVDKVDSYFGMRKISVEQVGNVKKIFLNNKPLYNLGFLDQGFWPDGIYTAPTDEALKFDVQVQKDFGYNMVRKHIKVEPQRWYYWADKLGLMVWQDMPSANSYRHNPPPVDTVQYRKELERMVDGRFNSPAIVTWVLFNETQGQKASDGSNLTQRMYDVVKAKDPNRLVNPASDNIYKDYIGDILDYHSYPGPKAVDSKTMATACGEFGSVGLVLNGHEWLAGKGVSGIMVKTAKELEDTYETYINMLAEFKAKNGMSGAVFTQLADVEQEINGFLSYDRVSKVNIPKVRAMNERLINQTIADTQQLLPDATTTAQVWKYTVTQPSADWFKPDFKTAGWKSGKGGFGAGSPPNSIVNTEWNTGDIWLRKEFKTGKLTASDLDNISFHIYHDEDYEIYLNGILVASAKGYTSNYVTVPLSADAKKVLKPNAINTIAVHCHQNGGGQYIDVGLFKVNYKSDR
ncbi:hypothetical protein GCM10023149_06040 [Mucilaginibacter gynuensis]|uniref:Glycosyl hydrolase family 2 n=1 Tax=Mucilaginibacter gynuensis TaxID=1302236 RepID=A0ABP8FUE8_9SPHI